jgi:hypothetical protein
VAKKLYRKYGGVGAAVLIDAFDDPVSSHLNKPELAKSHNDILRSFYASLNAASPYISFVFVTGTSRYAVTGLLSGVADLKDISFDPRYASICGFTPAELDDSFKEYFGQTLESAIASRQLPPGSSASDLIKKILGFYGGYSWDGQTKVLNPYSILKFFQAGEFDKYWQSSFPSAKFLRDVIGQSPLSFTPSKLARVRKNDLKMSLTGRRQTVASVFQNGYLTVAGISADREGELFSFRVPNSETRDDYYNALGQSLAQSLVKDRNRELGLIREAVLTKNGPDLAAVIETFYSFVESWLPTGNPRTDEEIIEHRDSYHDALWAYLNALSYTQGMEIPGPLGDSVLTLDLNEGSRAVFFLSCDCALESSAAEVSKGIEAAERAPDVYAGKRKGRGPGLPGKEDIRIGLRVLGKGQVEVFFVPAA